MLESDVWSLAKEREDGQPSKATEGCMKWTVLRIRLFGLTFIYYSVIVSHGLLSLVVSFIHSFFLETYISCFYLFLS